MLWVKLMLPLLTGFNIKHNFKNIRCWLRRFYTVDYCGIGWMVSRRSCECRKFFSLPEAGDRHKLHRL